MISVNPRFRTSRSRTAILAWTRLIIRTATYRVTLFLLTRRTYVQEQPRCSFCGIWQEPHQCKFHCVLFVQLRGPQFIIGVCWAYAILVLLDCTCTGDVSREYVQAWVQSTHHYLHLVLRAYHTSSRTAASPCILRGIINGASLMKLPVPQ